MSKDKVLAAGFTNNTRIGFVFICSDIVANLLPHALEDGGTAGKVDAVEVGAVGIILAHNHPSGDPSPSKEDIEATQNLVKASKIMNIDLLDHIIVGLGSYSSLKEKGIVK